MKRYRFSLLAAALLLAGAAGAFGQAPAPGATPIQGFNVPGLISQLSLYLPEDVTQGMFAGFGSRGQGAARGGGQGGGGQGGGQAGAAQSGTGGAAQGAQGGQSAGGQQRAAFQFTRDPTLFLTREQITQLLPIMSGLRENPMPTPSKAKLVQSSVDALLTAAQKAEYAQFQKALQQMRQGFQNRAGGGQGFPDFRAMTPEQRQQYIDSLPADQRQRFQDFLNRAGQQGQITPLELRQRQLDAFIKALQERLKQLQGA